MNRQMDRTEIWADTTISKTEMMQEYGSDVFDSSGESDQLSWSSYNTDWTPVSQRKSVIFETGSSNFTVEQEA